MSGTGLPAPRAAELCARILRAESQNAINREMKVAKATIRRFVAELRSQGVELRDRPVSPPRNALTSFVLERIKTTDDSNRGISSALGVPLCTVGRIRNKYYAELAARGVELPRCECGKNLHHPRVCASRNSKLLERRGISGLVAGTGLTVSDVRDLLLQGKTLQSVAETIGTTRTVIKTFLAGFSTEDRATRRDVFAVAAGKRRTAKMQDAVKKPNGLNPRYDPTYAKISAMVPRNIDPALRDDIISEAYVDFIYGRIKPNDLRAGIKRVQGRMFAAFANRWGDLSLDTAMSADSGATWIDRLEDPRALEAFDRMD